jgi:cell division inhibitor SepF
MGALRKAGVWLGFVEDDDERGYDDRDYRDSSYRNGYDDEFADDDEAEEVPVRTRVAERLSDSRTVRPISRTTPVASSSYATRDNLALAPQAGPRDRPTPSEEPERRYQITTLHPTTYNEARTIGEHFRDGVPVIINLTELEEADAKRLVDFAAGLAFGLRGTMERVTNRVFLLSPANVQVTAEDKARIAEGGFFNQS